MRFAFTGGGPNLFNTGKNIEQEISAEDEKIIDGALNLIVTMAGYFEITDNEHIDLAFNGLMDSFEEAQKTKQDQYLFTRIRPNQEHQRR